MNHWQNGIVKLLDIWPRTGSRSAIHFVAPVVVSSAKSQPPYDGTKAVSPSIIAVATTAADTIGAIVMIATTAMTVAMAMVAGTATGAMTAGIATATRTTMIAAGSAAPSATAGFMTSIFAASDRV